jgi:hypothetical protein
MMPGMVSFGGFRRKDGDREVVHSDQARSSRRRLSFYGATHTSAVGLRHGLSPVIWMLRLQHR